MEARKLGFWALLFVERDEVEVPRAKAWALYALCCLLNVAAVVPLYFQADPGGSQGPTLGQLSGIVAVMGSLPLLAALQPWIGVIKLLRIPRVAQAVVLLPLLALFGVLSVVVGLDKQATELAISGAVGGPSALVSLVVQVMSWRRQLKRASQS